MNDLKVLSSIPDHSLARRSQLPTMEGFRDRQEFFFHVVIPCKTSLRWSNRQRVKNESHADADADADVTVSRLFVLCTWTVHVTCKCARLQVHALRWSCYDHAKFWVLCGFSECFSFSAEADFLNFRARQGQSSALFANNFESFSVLICMIGWASAEKSACFVSRRPKAICFVHQG